MARGIHRLTALQVAKASRKGLTLCDGGGLYLQKGSSWIYRYKRNGRSRYLGLGPLDVVDLAAAREAALANRKLLFAGADPFALRATRRAKAATAVTFAEAAEAYLRNNVVKFRNSKHAAQWFMTLLGVTPDGREKTANNYCRIICTTSR